MEWSPIWLSCILASVTFLRATVDLTTVPNAKGEDLVCTHSDSHILSIILLLIHTKFAGKFYLGWWDMFNLPANSE